MVRRGGPQFGRELGATGGDQLIRMEAWRQAIRRRRLRPLPRRNQGGEVLGDQFVVGIQEGDRIVQIGDSSARGWKSRKTSSATAAGSMVSRSSLSLPELSCEMSRSSSINAS